LGLGLTATSRPSLKRTSEHLPGSPRCCAA